MEAGTANEVVPEDIEGAITDKTVALFYVKSHHCVQKGMVSLEVCGTLPTGTACP